MSFRLQMSQVSFSFTVLISLTILSPAAAINILNPKNETDWLALLSIKSSIGSDPYEFLTSWNSSIHFCRWQGVTCSIRHQRVMALNLSGMELRGTVSPYIGNLTFLKGLKLDNNFFRGNIPKEIGRLYRLQHISLYNNSFQGEIPINLTRCAKLRDINLGRNFLEGKVPSELSSLFDLENLLLSQNNLSGLIPSSLGNLSALRTLSLAFNNLEGSIPTEFAKISNLKFIRLSSNMLSGALPAQIFNISSLQYFMSAFNQLNGSFPWDLSLHLPGLAIFCVADNQFSGPLPASVTNASRLEVLDFGMNALSGPIPMNIGNLKQLQRLVLSGNPLGSESIGLNFLTSLTNCTNLTILYLNDNNHRGILPSSITNLSTELISLRLDGNYISGGIPESIGKLAKLQGLYLARNNFTGGIPSSIGKFSSLSVLEMQENMLNGVIPRSLGNCRRLLKLDLSHNRLTGGIPTSLSNCRDLQALNISQNQLTGALPKEMCSLFSFTVGLVLSQNHFTASLPLEVGNLKSLLSLDVSHNRFSGDIPTTIGRCEMLEFLRLEHNSLQGTLPWSLGQLKGIQTMDLSSNNFSGKIPASLGKLNFLSSLNLSFNMLEGEVPMDGVFTNTSSFSIVGNAKLCGGIEALNLPMCHNAPRKQRKLSALMLVVLATSIPLAVVLVLACVYAICRIRSSKPPPSSSSVGEKENLKISYAQVFYSTDGFSSENLIGEGKHGSVYKGIFRPDERVVAVKVLKLQQQKALNSFLAECEALRNIRHRNLVKIITSCSSLDFKRNDFKALVFEYVPNGSLETWLHPSSPENHDLKMLNLLQRLNIAIDIASALDYLHNHCERPIIHCDLKPSNILLGENHRAMISDFGLAKILSATDSKSNHRHSSSTGIRGTLGYVAPEYGLGGEVSVQGDIYSYGILLLEIFTGKRPTGNMFSESFSLHSYAKRALPHQVLEIVDPQISLEEENELDKTSQTRKGSKVKIEECCLSILRIGVSCSAEMQKERMDIKDAITELNSIKDEFLQL